MQNFCKIDIAIKQLSLLIYNSLNGRVQPQMTERWIQS